MACDIQYLMCPVLETVIAMPQFADKFGFVWQQQPCCFSDTSASQPLMMITVSEGLWSTFPLHPFRGLPLLQQHPHPVYKTGSMPEPCNGF